MVTALFAHESFAAHETPPGHPERAERAQVVAKALADDAFAGLKREEPPVADWEAIARVHGAAHLDLVREAGTAARSEEADGRLIGLDPDTSLGPHSLEAARRACGGMIAAVDGVAQGRFRNAFIAARPPGHHAEPDRVMGFCLFNTVAVGALHARATHGFTRVAVVDFDVHHGNGTQAAFWSDEDAFFGSTHQAPPHYPGTGYGDETGEGGTIINAPLSPGAGGAAFRTAMEREILPALDAFAPDMLFISAGFDAHARDPLGALEFEAADFAWATDRIAEIAEARCGGRIVSTLEGGYDLRALAESAAAHVAALMRAG